MDLHFLLYLTTGLPGNSSLFKKCLFIWLHQALVVAFRIFPLHCCLWDLELQHVAVWLPDQGLNLGSLHNTLPPFLKLICILLNFFGCAGSLLLSVRFL